MTKPNTMKANQMQTMHRALTPAAIRRVSFVAHHLKSSLLTLALFTGRLDHAAQTAAWTEITHPTSPAFAHHDMTYDSARHRLIVAGRTSIMENPFAIYAGAADGSWTQLPSPSPALPGREDIELAYDSHRDRVVLYTTATNKVWEFDGTNWHVITAPTTPIQCADGAQMQYDPVRRKTVLVGCQGFPEADSPSETWLWDGTDWTLAAGTDASPHGAAGGGMAFDAARGEIVLLTHSTMETWTFDGTNWTQRAPATTPTPGVWVFDLAFHPPSGLVVFYGGEHLDEQEPWNSTYPTNTWAWDGNNWRKLKPPTTPPATIDSAFTYFPERDGLVLHGGWGPGGDWGFRSNVWLLTLQPPCVPAPDGLLSWWPADGHFLDVIGTNHGTGVGGAGFAPGQSGQAFHLDGVNGHVQVAVPGGLPLAAQPRTLALWFKSASDLSVSTESALVQYGAPVDSQMFGLITSANALGRVYFYGHNADLAGTTRLQPNVWYHAAVTYDGTTLRLYLNGQLESNRPAALNTVLDANGLTIGNRPGSSKWQGCLDDVTIFNRALSSDEVAAIYAAGSAGMCPRLPEIRFTEIRLLGTDLSLTSTGFRQQGVPQVLQVSTNLALPNAWLGAHTNLAPTATNTWLVPRHGDHQFFRVLELP